MANPVLLLHGALGSKTQLDPLRTALVVEGFTTYALNFSGHSGEPFGKAFGIEAFGTDVLSFLDTNGIGTVDIFGYSMGGYVALWLAHSHPGRVGKIATLGTKFDWSTESAEKEAQKLDPDLILKKVPAFARILEHRHAPVSWRELLQKTSAMMLSLGNAPLLSLEVLKTIHQTVLILLGDRDDMADRKYSEEVARILPQGRFLLLNETPHPIEKTDVEVLKTILTDFFRR